MFLKTRNESLIQNYMTSQFRQQVWLKGERDAHAEGAARRAVDVRSMVLHATVGASAMVTVMETSLC
jgi:hypothetical protein